MAWLAQNPSQAQTTQQIAEATQVPASYLPKVFHPLVRAGLISGQRGIHGGYTLLRDADAITLFEIVESVDPIQRIKTCPLSLITHGTNLCPLHSLLDQILATESERLAKVRLSDLVKPSRGRPRPLCEVAELLRSAARAEPATKGRTAKVSTTAKATANQATASQPTATEPTASKSASANARPKAAQRRKSKRS